MPNVLPYLAAHAATVHLYTSPPVAPHSVCVEGNTATCLLDYELDTTPGTVYHNNGADGS